MTIAVILEATADCFDLFFHTLVDYQVVPSLLGILASFLSNI